MTRLAIITGAMGGIGSEIVRAFSSEGWKVLAIDRRAPEKNAKRAEPGVESIVFDVNDLCRDGHAQQEIEARITGKMGRSVRDLCIVNNAAIQICRPFDHLTAKDYLESISVNAVAPAMLVRSQLGLLAKTQGSVVNITSIHGTLTKPGFAVYAASKAALASITRSMAIELAPQGIRVNGVAPAAVQTRMLEDGFTGRGESLMALRRYHPANALGSPASLAGIVLFLAKSKDSFLNGATIEYNGGIGARLHDPE